MERSSGRAPTTRGRLPGPSCPSRSAEMSQADLARADRPPLDSLLVQVADYVLDSGRAMGAVALETAHLCLMDTLGCGFLALRYPACTRLLGPVVPGATLA